MLHVSLLGEQVIGDATGTVRTRSSRTVALVAFLVVHAGSPQTRQRIAALFWPDSTDEQALTNLRRELHHLRNALGGEPSLVVTPKDLCWRDTGTCRVDVRAFDSEREAALAAAATGDSEEVLAHAAAAVDQYRGEFLPGGYDDWLLDARTELERRCVELCDLICATRARTGDLTGAVDAARRRIQLRPLEEVGYRRLMELQGDLGDRAGAVSTYHHCASVLENELGVEPDPATRTSLDRLLARAGPAVAPVQAAEPAVGRSGLASARLVGRSAEFGVLQVLWRNAAGGHPSLALVRGDAGVGKTRLVAEVAEVARLQGAVVAGTQCFGASGRLALAPVAEWLRPAVVRSGDAGVPHVLPRTDSRRPGHGGRDGAGRRRPGARAPGLGRHDAGHGDAHGRRAGPVGGPRHGTAR
jgi:DNA-binding SARP family transcriptional activator